MRSTWCRFGQLEEYNKLTYLSSILSQSSVIEECRGNNNDNGDDSEGYGNGIIINCQMQHDHIN